MAKRAEYQVGYGHPPLHTRFQKGHSGNPGGPKRGSRNLTSVIAKALSETITVNENGRRRKITKLDAACIQLVNKAAAGDHRATKLLADILRYQEAREETAGVGAADSPDARRAADRKVLEGLREQLSSLDPGEDGDG